MIGDLIGDWIKGILIDGIMGNLSGLFSTVNTKVGEIASDVGTTPQAWNGGIFNMLQSLSETVIVPIAAAILAIIMCYELIDMIVEKNNMHDFDSSMFFRWMFKSAFAILIVTNTWNIVMGVFDATQAVVNQSAGVIIGETTIDFDTLIPDLEAQLEAMDIGPLLGLWFQTLVVGLTMNVLSICIFLVTYGRMIEIYAVTALGPIPLATMGNAEWRGMGQNYLKSLLALGFQAFFDFCGEAKERHPDTAVIFLTANDMESDMLKGYELGADDYVTKPFHMSVFQKKLAALLGRIAKQSGGECYDDGILFINFSEMTATLSGEAIIFTPLEYRLLKVLTKNPKVVLTRQVLLEKLWDIDGNFVDEHALTAAVSRVRNKIEADGQQYIKTVYGMGYMWIGGLQK